MAAIEFAFVAPLAILLFVGLAQLSQAIIASRHASHSSASVGDLIAQCNYVNDTDLSNYFAAGSDILAPMPVTSAILGQRITSVQMDNKSKIAVQWSQASDPSGLTKAYTVGAAPSPALPSNLLTAPPLTSSDVDSVIVAETVYKYTFPVALGNALPFGTSSVSLSFGRAINFDEVTYFKPRKSSYVHYTGSGPGTDASNPSTSCSGS